MENCDFVRRKISFNLQLNSSGYDYHNLIRPEHFFFVFFFHLTTPHGEKGDILSDQRKQSIGEQGRDSEFCFPCPPFGTT